jgi:NAD(P)-dependent dehydrogenase (short-subunit alcohol dehydrogenase family)
VLEVNLHGVYRTVKLTLPHVVARRGHVLVVASVYAFANGALASPYAVSKAAVEALGRALRVELAPHGASAGVAYFGFIDTKLVRDAFDDPITQGLREGLPGFIAKPLPVGRAGSAVVRGLERRSARVMVPRYVPVLQVLRGLLPFTLDRQVAGDERTLAALQAADAAAIPAAAERAGAPAAASPPTQKLTQASPSR